MRMLRSSVRRCQWAVHALGALQLISWGTAFYIFGLTLVTIEKDLGLSRNSTAFVFPLALLFEGLFSVLAGRLIARQLGRYVMTVGSLLGGAGLFVLSQATSLMQLQVAWALVGASFACTLYTPLFSIFVTDYPTAYRSKVTTVSLITGFSTTIFLPLGGWLMAEMGWRDCLLMYAMINIFFCAPAHWYLLKWIQPQERVLLHATANEVTALVHPLGWPNASGYRFKVYSLLAVFVSSIGAISVTLSAYLIPMLIEQGLSMETALLAPAAIGTLQIVSRLLMLRQMTEKNVHRLNAFLIVLFPLAIFLLQASGKSVSILLVFIAVYGAAHGGWTTVRATAVPQYLGAHGAALSNGTIAAWATVGRIALPALVGLTWTSAQGYANGYQFMLIVSLLGLGCYVLAQLTYFKTIKSTNSS
jgi:MFS family permease